MEIEILDVKNRSLGKCRVQGDTTVKALKNDVEKLKPALTIHRQSIRLEPRGKTLKDSDTVQSLGISSGGKLYVKDLGPQISWKGVFLAEYAGPIAVYMLFYQRPSLIYGAAASNPISFTANVAAICWAGHYAKRILETLFVHRFSHATMPLRNLFKNCSYYWAFAAYVAYHVNHPLFTEPSTPVFYAGLAGFLISELGNFSIHMLLRNLRPAGSTVRKIPVPDANPLTQLFNFVSCPNYTYEFFSWLSFSLMTTCIPSLVFAAAGMYQMTVWAIGKHKNYKKEFKDYPKGRKAILPFAI
ncbi:probable very-long-chain enoyl-CoA reductase art-1 [Culex quinquefasciatus]|uniref:probable very-long-chain enoyl-CoA reductase art-1 n=1 Tax=Culex quinquefasciatus TaxID=7176 RepID=UPI0018E3603C|nr:probable very-long-chain enoyl-CoA reductase art-1 [Culex quinquefasciatus]